MGKCPQAYDCFGIVMFIFFVVLQNITVFKYILSIPEIVNLDTALPWGYNPVFQDTGGFVDVFFGMKPV